MYFTTLITCRRHNILISHLNYFFAFFSENRSIRQLTNTTQLGRIIIFYHTQVIAATIMEQQSTNDNSSVVSKSEVADLRDAFRLFDVGDKGVISFQELKKIAESLAQENDNNNNNNNSKNSFYQRLCNVLSEMQTNDDDEEDMDIDENAFVRIMSEQYQRGRGGDNDDEEDEYQRVFDLFDTKGKGYISMGDLRRIAQDLGESMTDDELNEMVSKAAPHTGEVTREDFQRIMTMRLFS